jgi:predicted PhzF superfamily epimerase YddE/YHI9
MFFETFQVFEQKYGGRRAMSVRIVQVDAFTAEPFRGNPAGVCILDQWAPERWMQAVAAEMNLSETAFLVRHPAGFEIRYFTPSVEVPLCGHATLASAHVLWEDSIVPMESPISLRAKGGLLAATREGVWIRLDFPAIAASKVPIPAGLSEALGAEVLRAHRTWENGYLVEFTAEAVVRDLAPDFTRLRRFGPIIATAAAPAPQELAQERLTACDFVSRCFAPGLGIDEDPVTGVAHCCLAPFWATRLGKSDMVGHQLSRRGGVVRVRARGDRVHLLGQAVTVMRGEILGPS